MDGSLPDWLVVKGVNSDYSLHEIRLKDDSDFYYKVYIYYYHRYK